MRRPRLPGCRPTDRPAHPPERPHAQCPPPGCDHNVQDHDRSRARLAATTAWRRSRCPADAAPVVRRTCAPPARVPRSRVPSRLSAPRPPPYSARHHAACPYSSQVQELAMESVTSLQHSSISDVLTLARRFEPVLRYTKGELFLPMPVERYVEAAALLRRVPGQKVPEVVAPATKINLSSLISYAWEGGGTDLELNFVDKPLSRTAYRRWRRRPDRPLFQGGTPFAVVGILGRFVDSIMRFSLIVRGKVPGGFAAAAHIRYEEGGDIAPTYYVRAIRDAGYLVLQYWFFYAMNDWRTTFSGVNDHEPDWEQITLFLSEPDAGGEPELAWVAFSSHDEVGDDLRRRVDDPDLQLVNGTHPVVHVGAGSHSGAYLPGDYLVSVSPPAVEKLTQQWRRFVRTITRTSSMDQRPGSVFPSSTTGVVTDRPLAQAAIWPGRQR